MFRRGRALLKTGIWGTRATTAPRRRTYPLLGGIQQRPEKKKTLPVETRGLTPAYSRRSVPALPGTDARSTLSSTRAPRISDGMDETVVVWCLCVPGRERRAPPPGRVATTTFLGREIAVFFFFFRGSSLTSRDYHSAPFSFRTPRPHPARSNNGGDLIFLNVAVVRSFGHIAAPSIVTNFKRGNVSAPITRAHFSRGSTSQRNPDSSAGAESGCSPLVHPVGRVSSKPIAKNLRSNRERNPVFREATGKVDHRGRARRIQESRAAEIAISAHVHRVGVTGEARVPARMASSDSKGEALAGPGGARPTARHVASPARIAEPLRKSRGQTFEVLARGQVVGGHKTRLFWPVMCV